MSEQVAGQVEQDATAEAAPQATVEQAFSYYFREDKLGNKRPTIELRYDILTAFGVAQALSSGDPKQVELIVECVNDAIHSQVREQLASNINLSQASLDISKLTLAAIANLPKAVRRGGGISKETWEAFGQDYMEVMLAVTKKEQEKIEKHVAILTGKFQAVKSNKAVVEFMRGALQVWFANTKQAEEFKACYELLDNKADALLKADETAVLENL